jgi:hypothetical protein
MEKDTIHQKVITVVLCIDASTNRNSKYRKQILTQVKGEINKARFRTEDYSSSLSTIRCRLLPQFPK